jgi:hypothetical protein
MRSEGAEVVLRGLQCFVSCSGVAVPLEAVPMLGRVSEHQTKGLILSSVPRYTGCFPLACSKMPECRASRGLVWGRGRYTETI